MERPIRVRLLGRVSFEEAYDLQRALIESDEDYLLVLEHPLTITLGRRASIEHVLADPNDIGASLVETDRGGDVTLHGPGQVVGYAVISLNDDPHEVARHVDRLEQAMIETVQELCGGANVGGIGRIEGTPGVWIGIDTEAPAKIGAVGVRIERVEGRRRTMHGVALNVDIDLASFDAIVPCGIADRSVTSLRALGIDVDMATVAQALASHLSEMLGAGRPTEVASTWPAIRTIEGAPHTEPASFRRIRRAGVNPDDGLAIAERKPPWLRVPVRLGEGFSATKSVVADLGLVTVCEEAGCPNIFECWDQGTATFMVNGDRCTRACGFCLVDTSKPLPLDPSEPTRVAEAVARMGLSHAVVTCVARDDLPDGGAGAIARTVEEIREACPETAVEVLVSDLKGDREALGMIIDAAPDVLNHNIETIARLSRAVRPSAGYARSLALLARAASAGLVTKSGLMLGLGERDDEVVAALGDLAAVGVSVVTIGQYLRPTAGHLPVARYADPSNFAALAEAGRQLGLAHVQSSPLTRSSYHAREAAAAASAVPVVLSAR